jgi:hypothetical protein
LTQKIRLINEKDKARANRNEFYSDLRLDFFDISDELVRRNAFSVAAVCMSTDLLPNNIGYFELRTKPYGRTFNLCENEPFYNQPIAAGRMGTCVLVGEDIIATAPYFVNEKNIDTLRFVFGFVMEDPISPIEKIPDSNIYKGVEILQRVYNLNGNWVLVRLDRKVTDRDFVKLSQVKVYTEQPVYVLGNPCGLPLKYAPGNYIREVAGDFFKMDMDIYSGNAGSPIFNAETHELIGLVSRKRFTNLRWTGTGWITLPIPGSRITTYDYPLTSCACVLQYNQYIVK